MQGVRIKYYGKYAIEWARELKMSDRVMRIHLKHAAKSGMSESEMKVYARDNTRLPDKDVIFCYGLTDSEIEMYRQKQKLFYSLARRNET